MTSLIPLAADRFLIRPPAQYMIHHGTYMFSGHAGGEADTAFQELQNTRRMMLDIYVTRLKEQGKFKDQYHENIRQMLADIMQKKSDVWLSADEAVEWGFIDSVFEGDYSSLRAGGRNLARRARMMDVIRRPAKIEGEK
jgi:ATP-dependent protease ClpP protease subunit